MVKKINRSQLAGFTLIELIVAVAISVTIVGLSIASFLEFNDRQRMANAKKELEMMINLTVNQAQAGKMGACKKLVGYRFWAVGAKDFKIKEVCAPALPADDYDQAEVYYSLPENILLTDSDSFDFVVSPLSGIITQSDGEAGPWVVTLQDSIQEKKFSFTLSANGYLSTGDWD